MSTTCQAFVAPEYTVVHPLDKALSIFSILSRWGGGGDLIKNRDTEKYAFNDNKVN